MDTFLLRVEYVMFLPLTWLDFLLSPFSDFTFTDAADFFFATLIVVTLGLVIFRHTKRPYPTWWVRFASASSFLLAVLTPLVPLAALYLLSWRAETVLGHWPRALIDDPKYICNGDALYHKLRNAAIYASAFAGWGLFTWAALLLHLWGRLSKKQLLWQMGVFLAAWVAFSCEPGERYWWWQD